MEWVTVTIGVIEGVAAIIVALAAASKKIRGLVVMPLKEWLKKTVEEATHDKFETITNHLGEIDAKLDEEQKHKVVILRHEITLIYEKYRLSKRLPQRIKQNLCSLYEQYQSLGGNSYVSTIVNEMLEEWEEV